MNWRYQPVFEESEDGPVFGVCEVYFSDDGKLEGWTEVVEPNGESPEDFRNALARMLLDAWQWKPVAFEDLKPGYAFEQLAPEAEFEALVALLQDKGVISKD